MKKGQVSRSQAISSGEAVNSEKSAYCRASNRKALIREAETYEVELRGSDRSIPE